MAPICFADGEHTMRRVIWGYIYTFKIKIPIKDNTWNLFFFTVIQETIAKFGESRLAFIRKTMYSLLSQANYKNMWDEVFKSGLGKSILKLSFTQFT